MAAIVGFTAKTRLRVLRWVAGLARHLLNRESLASALHSDSSPLNVQPDKGGTIVGLSIASTAHFQGHCLHSLTWGTWTPQTSGAVPDRIWRSPRKALLVGATGGDFAVSKPAWVT